MWTLLFYYYYYSFSWLPQFGSGPQRKPLRIIGTVSYSLQPLNQEYQSTFLLINRTAQVPIISTRKVGLYLDDLRYSYLFFMQTIKNIRFTSKHGWIKWLRTLVWNVSYSRHTVLAWSLTYLVTDLLRYFYETSGTSERTGHNSCPNSVTITEPKSRTNFSSMIHQHLIFMLPPRPTSRFQSVTWRIIPVEIGPHT